MLTNNIRKANAKYREERLPMYRDNPLVRALPPLAPAKEVLDSLKYKPVFEPYQLEWSAEERIAMLPQLQNFMVPMACHVGLVRAMDNMLRAGYVGRAPNTPEFSAMFQKLYEMQQAGMRFSQLASSRIPQISSSLIGVSGMGKTSTIERWAAMFPEVIYHPDLNHYQIPVMITEAPSDGSSVKGLAHGLLHQVDRLVPGNDYYKQYSQNGRAGSESLMWAVARTLGLHSVGLLVVDEIQNLENCSKKEQVVLTELVTACNIMKVPILFTGTNRARKVLGSVFRKARRATGHNIPPWDRLRQSTATSHGEWDGFLNALWKFQWNRNPVELTTEFNNKMYDLSQGIIDIAIKLFGACQARAILDGSETLTVPLLEFVYREQFSLVDDMLDALRRNDAKKLALHDDVTVLNFERILQDAEVEGALQSSPLTDVTAEDPRFVDKIAGGLATMGLDGELAMRVAESVAAQDPNMPLGKGIVKTVEKLVKPRSIRPSKTAKTAQELPADRFDERPEDYRRAVAHADAKKGKVIDELVARGMAPPLESIISI